MKRLLLITLSLIMGFEINAQVLNGDSIGKSYFENGTKMLEIGHYHGADSLLTLALCSFKNVNVYYNRGVAKLYLQDTSGFCQDISIAANKYFDPDASRLFNEYCCKKVDTIFYNLRYASTDKNKYVYYEVIQTLKYDTVIIGTYHYKNIKEKRLSIDFGCDQSIIALNLIPTDIYASYFLNDTIKCFFLSPDPISVLNESKYSKVKDEATTLLNGKYKEIKTKNQVDEVTLYYEITYSNEGEIMKVKYKGTFPEVAIGDIEPELENDLLQIVNKYPKVKPAKFRGENVFCVTYDFITF